MHGRLGNLVKENTRIVKRQLRSVLLIRLERGINAHGVPESNFEETSVDRQRSYPSPSGWSGAWKSRVAGADADGGRSLG